MKWYRAQCPVRSFTVFSVDAVAAARVISDFAKTNDKLVVKAGAFDGKLLDQAGVASLASIPSKEVLLSQLAGLLMSPIARFARVLAAIAEKNSAPAPDAPAAESAIAAESAPAAEPAPVVEPVPAADSAPAGDTVAV